MSKIFLIFGYLTSTNLKSKLYNNSLISKKFSIKAKTSSKTSSKILKEKKDTKENPQINSRVESNSSAQPKTKTSGENPSTKSTTNESIFLFSHETAKKYYLLNFSFLSIYSALCMKISADPEYPDFLRTSMNGFIGLTSFGLVFLLFFSRRHVYSIYLQKPSNILLIKTYSMFGFGNKKYQLPVNDVKEIISLDRKFKKIRTGVYMIKPNEKYKYFYLFNGFFIRPSKNNNYMFDEIFAKKIKK